MNFEQCEDKKRSLMWNLQKFAETQMWTNVIEGEAKEKYKLELNKINAEIKAIFKDLGDSDTIWLIQYATQQLFK